MSWSSSQSSWIVWCFILYIAHFLENTIVCVIIIIHIVVLNDWILGNIGRTRVLVLTNGIFLLCVPHFNVELLLDDGILIWGWFWIPSALRFAYWIGNWVWALISYVHHQRQVGVVRIDVWLVVVVEGLIIMILFKLYNLRRNLNNMRVVEFTQFLLYFL